MANKITQETRELMTNLYGQGLSTAEIAGRVNVLPLTVCNHTRSIERGFDSYGAYQVHLAKERGFASIGQYHAHLAKKRGFASYGAYQLHLAKERGFASIGQYLTHLAKKRGFDSYGAYQVHLAKERGFDSIGEYQAHLAKERGFASIGQYQAHLARERQQRPENQRLSDLILSRLKELGKTQGWLAGQLEITPASVSYYTNGQKIPGEKRLKMLFEALEVPYQTLDDLVGEEN